MDADFLKYILAVLSGLITAIPLVVKLIEYVQRAVKEKNWNQLLRLVMQLMETAETKFDTGAERKDWVLSMVKASSDTINYDIDLDRIAVLIDSLCDMSKIVNAPNNTQKAGDQV